jgi:hypothetical protein
MSETLPNLDKHEEEWREFRRRSTLSLVAIVGFLPVVMALGALTRKLFHSGRPFFVFATFWMLFVGISGYRRRVFLCPRCGKRFFRARFYYNDFASKCVHCKLPLYSKMTETPD